MTAPPYWGFSQHRQQKAIMAGVNGWLRLALLFLLKHCSSKCQGPRSQLWKVAHLLSCSVCTLFIRVPCSITYGQSLLSHGWPWEATVFSLCLYVLWSISMSVWRAQMEVPDHFSVWPRPRIHSLGQRIFLSDSSEEYRFFFSPPSSLSSSPSS